MRNLLLLSSCLVLVACQSKPADSYSGYVESQAVSISAPQSGWLAAVNVDRGDAVTEGEALFRLDATQAEHALSGAESRAVAAQASAADLAKGAREADIAPLLAQRIQAQSQLDLARANETRYAQLEPKGYVSAAQMDSLRAATKSAQAQLINIDKLIAEKRLASREDQQRAAQAQAAAASADVAGAQYTVDDRDVKARLTGQVDERLREPGEFVAAGAAVLTVRPKGREFVRFYVPQGDLSKFRVGAVVHVGCDGCVAQTAKVRFISPEAEFTPPVIYSVKERQKLMFLIEATPEKPEALHAGQPVDIRL
ncbi:HlyD family secretion protein [Asticcacaulis sp.]|uniref:HlyD family secretion protein n=1 Tax=Asticcacaulis sp. TaxID=1872648 RepID=UPI002CAC8489|nr:HlyD family efflux transporter periplasmic adaptor subunit [Asticcacaulis sp.]HTM81674.1 HlyD family efflux transporter periplasmic adaptor subunit [Asticcacaulis sp.]